ncbi:MAG: ABC transporter ATP-binding protein [Bacilli bacterium]|jgi:ATP-binding cassette subfamily B multidrug efflux pump
MLKIFKYLRKKEWTLIIISFLLIVSQVWLDLKIPDYMAEITKLVQTSGNNFKAILNQGLFMLLCTLGSVILTIIISFFSARIASVFAKNLRSKLFSKVNSLSMKEINQFSSASLITRSTNDITQIQILIMMSLQIIIKAPIMASLALVKISGKGLEWSLLTLFAVLILITFITAILIFVLPKFKQMQELTDELNKVTKENLSGLRVIKAYNADSFQEEKFNKVNTKLTNTKLYTSRSMVLLMPLMSLVMSSLSLFIYWIGAYLIAYSNAPDALTIFSNMVVFSSYAIQVIMSFMMLGIVFIMIPRASISAKRINEVLKTIPSIFDGPLTKGKDHLQGEIEFRNVSFKYYENSEYVLKDLNFTIKKGETFAFIGPTGAGKTTLVNLIPRFFDVTEGEVLVNGINVKDYVSKTLYNKIGYVSQKALLFQGTVNFNVSYGENENQEKTPKMIKEAIEIAQGKDFVLAMKNQYEEEIARGGTNISGGQKQRLSIARAICHQPEIYIFDDSFSALDYKTERLLKKALKEKSKDITTLIISQRIGSIIDADQIIVLDEGKIVGKGTHQELLNNCQVYQEIAISQLNEKELML